MLPSDAANANRIDMIKTAGSYLLPLHSSMLILLGDKTVSLGAASRWRMLGAACRQTRLYLQQHCMALRMARCEPA